MPQSATSLQLDTPPTYLAYAPEPDVWWGEDGIDAGRGIEPSLYERPLRSAVQAACPDSEQ
jgi:hypothetical protein